MVANVLRSDEAVQMSVFVVRAFIRMRNVLTDTSALAAKLDKLEREVTARLDSHEGAIVGYIRGYLAALDWLFDSRNREEAVAIYRRNIPQASEAGASKAYEVLLGGSEGFQRKAKLDLAGAKTVLELRGEYGRPAKKLADPARYIDESYYDRALKARP